MGVQGLWPLLEPVGRRVNIEALTNKRLAVDASIWLVQFIKAMRNEKGEMLHNAHLLGFFRRICRLLFHRIRPVFVFDGATPALKKRTTIARRRRREEQSAKLRKTAEKLLLNQLKKHALKNMSGSQQAAVLQQAKQTSTAGPTESEEIPADLLAAAGSDFGNLPESYTSRPAIDLTAPASDQPSMPPSTAGDALLAAQLQEEDQEVTRLASNGLASTSGIHIIHGKPFTRRNSTFQGHLAPISSVDEVDMVISKLLEDSKTASATHNILGYRVYDQSSGKVVQDFHDDGEGGAGIKIMHLLQDSNVRNVLVVVSRWFGGMLLGPARFMYITDAARGMLNQGGYLQPKALVPTTSAPNAVPMEDSSSSEEEAEAILPEGLDELDPAVLSTLPPSLQLEFAMKLRERKQAENREHFQKHTGQPQAFSSFQLQQYLKGTQLKREVEKMKDAVNAAAGGDGVPTRRIAGDAGREYILQMEDDTKAKAALDAEPSSRTLSSGRLEIEIEVSADHVDPHKPSPGGNDSSEEEWETVGAEGTSAQLSPSDNPDSASKGRNWRERATHRQKYWSRMTGFQFGRKLGDWGKDEDPEAKASKEVRASEVEDAELQQAIARSLQDTKQGASGDVEDGDSDVEWMDSEPMPESQLPSQLPASLRSSANGNSGALKPPLPAAASARPSSQPPVKHNQISLPAAPGLNHHQRQHAVSAIGRHQTQAPADSQLQPRASADSDSQHQATAGASPQHQSHELVAGFPASQEQDSGLPQSPDTQLGKSQSLAKAPQQSARSQGPEAEQQASPITSPFKKVLSPWEKGNQHQPANQTSPSNGLNESSKQSMGKRKRMTEKAYQPVDSEPAVDNLQRIIAQTDDTVKDQQRDSVLLDTLKDVPDDLAMPFSIEDRGIGLSNTANSNTTGSSPESQAPDAAQPKGPMHEETEEANPEDVIDMTASVPLVKSGAASASQPLGFDTEVSADFESGLIAALDRSSKQHPANHHPMQLPQAPAAAAAVAAAGPAAAAPSTTSLDQSGGSKPADILHHWQEVHQHSLIQQQHEHEQQQQQPQQQQQGHNSAPFDMGPSAGVNGSLPAPSEVGLGEYGSAALDPGVSVGVSSTLPSFDLDAEMASLDKQTKRLQSQHRAQVRNADSPSSEMYGECQELLQMFGLPYIIAPMEAEAQCAWLDETKLVDGVVTDDNDVFLFGGQHVYRNIFEGKKYVEEYRVQDVESELGMSRDKLIQLALLLGSDYTEGVAGIGIVNAVEIVNAFPTEELLVNFRKWVLTPDAQLITALGGTEDVDPDEHIRAFKHTHTGLRKNWDVPETFPNTAVIKAYKDAKVDENKDKFTYGRPDLQLLRRFCLDKFGWQQDRADELLVPVLKAYDDNQTQMTLDSFLSFSQRFAKIKSRRLQKAVAGITGVANSEMTFGDEIQDLAPKRRKAGKKGKAAQQEPDAGGAVVSRGFDPSGTGAGAVALGPAAEMPDSEPAELSRTGAAEVAADADAVLPSSQGKGGPGKSRQRASKASTASQAQNSNSAERRGRGQGRGRSRGRGRGRGSAKQTLPMLEELSASSSDSDVQKNDEQPRTHASDAPEARQLRKRSGSVHYDERARQQEGVLANNDSVDWAAAVPHL